MGLLKQNQTMRDKVEFKLIELDRRIKQAEEELQNENLSMGQIAKVHLELKNLKFGVQLLKELSYDN